jgi:hypothetical protein
MVSMEIKPILTLYMGIIACQKTRGAFEHFKKLEPKTLPKHG